MLNWELAGDGPSVWGLVTHTGDPDAFLVPGFSLAQPWVLQDLGTEPADERALSVSLSFK